MNTNFYANSNDIRTHVTRQQIQNLMNHFMDAHGAQVLCLTVERIAFMYICLIF